MEKLCGERLVVLHEDRHQEGMILLGQREGHKIGTFGQPFQYRIDERLGAKSFV